MMLDLNEAERWEQAQATATAEAREATNRRRLSAVVIVFSCMLLFAGKSAVPRRPNGLFSPRQLLGLKPDKCDGVTCLNGGACNSNTGRCVCPAGFSGDSCEITDQVVDPCDGVLCLNGGACDPNTGLCVCPTGFTGPRCENTVDKCAGVTCLNGGACNSNTGLCVCPPGFTGDRCQIPVSTPGVKHVFATDQSWNGNLGGLVGADAKCQAAADAAGLDGMFKAWLSDSSQSAVNRLSHSQDAYVLPNHGPTVANDWDDLVTVDLDRNIDRDENGNFQGGDVWTGTNEHGNQHGGHCQNWESSDISERGLAGDTGEVDDDWTDEAQDTCNTKNHLYCFEQ